MKLLLKAICYTSVIFSLNNAYALDQMAKEETTPPAAEGALTPEQLIPQLSADKNKTEQMPDTKISAPNNNE